MSNLSRQLQPTYKNACISGLELCYFIYQACKNGLVQHLEHLLYYGAEIDARTASGNTALHVAALNNQVPNLTKIINLSSL